MLSAVMLQGIRWTRLLPSRAPWGKQALTSTHCNCSSAASRPKDGMKSLALQGHPSQSSCYPRSGPDESISCMGSLVSIELESFWVCRIPWPLTREGRGGGRCRHSALPSLGVARVPRSHTESSLVNPSWGPYCCSLLSTSVTRHVSRYATARHPSTVPWNAGTGLDGI